MERLRVLSSGVQNLACLCKRIAEACETNWVCFIWILQLFIGFVTAIEKRLDSVRFIYCFVLLISGGGG